MASSSAPTILQAISSALTLLAPLFAIAFLGWAHSRPSSGRAQSDTHRRISAVVAYTAIVSLAVLCTVAGALGLTSAITPARGAPLGKRGRGEAVVETLVFLELGASVLYLVNEHLIHGMKVYWVIALVIELACATAVSLIYSPLSSGGVSPFLPPILSLLFTASVLPVLGLALHADIAKQCPNNARASPMAEIRTPVFSSANVSPTSSTGGSLPHNPEKISPKSSLSDITAVNHCRVSCPQRNGHIDANTLESGAARSDESSGSRANHSTGLLVSLVASQVAAFLAFIFQIAAVKVGMSASLSSAPSSNPSAHLYAILQISRAAFMVLCIIGTMSALLLHAYYDYLRVPSSGRQATTDHPILPPVVDLSRMDAITVSLSTAATTSPPIPATKKRSPSGGYIPSFDKSTRKLSFKSRITSVAASAGSRQILAKGPAGSRFDCGMDEENRESARKTQGPLSRHGYSASSSSSFACPMARSVPLSTPLESEREVPLPRSTERDSKFDDNEDGEPGYAYIYTDGQASHTTNYPVYSMDPLDVGRPAPFGQAQRVFVGLGGPSFQSPSHPSKHVSLQPSRSDSVLTNQAVENSFSSTVPSSPLSLTHGPIDIPAPRFANPYPTPRSTPTANAFSDIVSSPDPPVLTIDSVPPLQTSHLTTENPNSPSGDCWLSYPQTPSSSEKRSGGMDQNSVCSSSTDTPFRASTPTPTPTRAPTPGLSFTPFIGSHVRKRDSSSSRNQRQPPSPPSAFMANLKGKAKTLSSKHGSISESLSQNLEGIRHGLGGSNGKTKYPLRSSTSQGNLGLGLGISSGFKFPQLTRRASELDHLKSIRNISNSTLAITAEGVEPDEESDFMDLRDPFACPSTKNGGALRIVSQAELSWMGGRESRTGYRDDDCFDLESVHQGTGPGSYGKARGLRMSAWGKMPIPPSCSSSTSNSPFSTRYYRSTSPSPARTPTKSKHRSEKKGKSKSKSRKADSSCSGSAESAGHCSLGPELPLIPYSEDCEFICEEALIAQQLLMKLDEKLWAASESAPQA